MGIWDKLRGELIDIVEWTTDHPSVIVHRFERHNNEIKHGAKLTVREGQAAVFVNEGEIADVFTPGMHTLDTANLPLLSTIQGWKYGFESPFKAEVYFVATRRFTDLKWGTKNPLMLRDKEFGPVRLRAFGTYEIKATQPAALIREVVGTHGRFTVEQIEDQLRNVIVSRFADILGESKIPVLDLAANYDELGGFIETRIKPEFDRYGLDITKLLVENISLPPAVEEALDKRTSMGVVGDLNAYTKFQAAEAIGDAARNEGAGGLAAGGMGAGLGIAIGQQMAGALTPEQATQQQAAPAAPPPLPTAIAFHVALRGQAAGPFDEASLKTKIADGSLTRDTLVWRDGMAGWAKAGEVAELIRLFGPPAPPPIPGT